MVTCKDCACQNSLPYFLDAQACAVAESSRYVNVTHQQNDASFFDLYGMSREAVVIYFVLYIGRYQGVVSSAKHIFVCAEKCVRGSGGN